MKSNRKNYHLKFKDKVVDSAANSSFIFNKTPILVPVLADKQEGKRDRTKSMQHRSQFDESFKKLNDGNERPASLMEAAGGYTPFEGDLFSYFKTTKLSCKSVEVVPKPKYYVGSLVLTAVCDRGIGGKYLVTSFSRNTKGYIDFKQLSSSHNPYALGQYSGPGGYVVGQTVKGDNPKHIQLSLSNLNGNLNEKQIRVGQCIPGYVKSKEELGCLIRVSKTAEFKYFLPKHSLTESEFEALVYEKQYLFWVAAVDVQKRFVTLSLTDSLMNFRGLEEEELAKLDIEQFISPGHRVNVKVIKVLRNGLLVKFLKVFYGYIFMDELVRELEEYKEGETLESRIISMSTNPPKIFLSEKHTNLTPFEPKRPLYTGVDLPEDLNLQEGVYISRSEGLMVHPLQLHESIDAITKLYIKENNYFDKYQICSSRKLGLRVGQVSRVIPFQNFKVYGRGKGKFRVMSLDVWNKVLKASYDPLVLAEKDKQLTSLGDIELDKQYAGFISTVSPNGIIVEFQNSIKGLVNAHEIKLNGGDVSNYQQGQGVLVYIRAAKYGLLELALTLTRRYKRKRSQSLTLEDGQKLATVYSINTKSIQPLYVRLNKRLVALSIFKHIATPDKLQSLLPLEQHFRIGDKVKLYVKDNEYYLYSPDEEQTDDELKICRVVAIQSSIARLQFGKDQFGSCHITYVTDMILPNPLHTELDVGSYRVGRVISEGWFSLRESIVKNGIPKDMKECVSRYGDAEKNGDYRSRLLVLPNGGGLKAGMLFFGYVKAIGDKGCFVSLSSQYDIRVELSELSDEKVVDVHQRFPENKLVMGRLLTYKIKPNNPTVRLFDGSLRYSVVLYGYQFNFDTLKIGLTVGGFVSGYTKGNAIVGLQACKYRGIISPQNHQSGHPATDPLEKIFPLGMHLQCKIIAFETEPKLLIKLSTLEKHFKMYYGVADALHNEDSERVFALLESVKSLNSKYEQQQNQKTNEKYFYFREEDVDEDEYYNRIKQLLQEKGMDDGEDDEEVEGYYEMEVEENEQDEDVDLAEVDSEYGSQQEEKQTVRREEARTLEPALLDDYVSNMERLPYSSAHYQSLVLSSPTVESHLKYISSLMQEKRVEEIRQQFARAINSLPTIKDKYNMWIAWINMETVLGDFENTVRKAIESGASYKIYFRIIDILVEQENWKVVIEFARGMVKKFATSIQAWNYLLKVILLFRKDRYNNHGGEFVLPKAMQPKEILHRARQVLTSKELILLETQYAILEYQIGYPYQARTSFESLLSNHPKRTDIWSVYVDMYTKHGDLTKLPGLFERALTLKLKPKKTKFILKKYLAFAEQHLSEKEVKTVLDKATAYAREHFQQESDESDDQ